MPIPYVPVPAELRQKPGPKAQPKPEGPPKRQYDRHKPGETTPNGHLLPTEESIVATGLALVAAVEAAEKAGKALPPDERSRQNAWLEKKAGNTPGSISRAINPNGVQLSRPAMARLLALSDPEKWKD